MSENIRQTEISRLGKATSFGEGKLSIQNQHLAALKQFDVLFFAKSAGAVEYTKCFSAKG